MDVAKFSLDASMEAIRAYEDEIRDAWKAKKDGIPVAWTSVWGPYQLVIRAFGFPYIGVETCAEWFGRTRLTGGFTEEAEREGLVRDVCNFLTGPYGYLLAMKTLKPNELPWTTGFPDPDFTLEVNCLCDDQMKVFQNITRMKAKRAEPWHAYRIDVPFNVTGGNEDDVEQTIVDYEVNQIREIIRKMEIDTGVKLDEVRLERTIDNANRMSAIGKEITELRKTRPSPMAFLDAQVCVLDPMLNLLGTDRGVEVMQKALAEVKAKVADGTGVVEDEKIRLMWSNTPTWPNMGLFSYWHPSGVVFAFETNSTSLRFHQGYKMDRNNPLETMCRKFLPHATNSDKGRTIKDRVDLIESYSIDGVVHSSNYGCRPYSLGEVDELISIREKKNVPQIIIDQDMTNEQFYDDRKIKTQIQALIEAIQTQKGI